ncbi:hypothetical protein Y1Q_0011065 [Alligator mississippiensis]|uniref:Uncharacterized protein n=1 Tax=Alligator mississippiensis TaxID=8496 RepID=A0A151NXR8_ALLMI|nr:hypothetical protein Y1Q_0011065 [Alligator mississippiensis]
MHQLWQHRTEDRTWPLDQLVTVAEEHLADSQAWRMEDIALGEARDQCEEERDWWRDQEDQEFGDRLLALENRHMEALE